MKTFLWGGWKGLLFGVPRRMKRSDLGVGTRGKMPGELYLSSALSLCVFLHHELCFPTWWPH